MKSREQKKILFTIGISFCLIIIICIISALGKPSAPIDDNSNLSKNNSSAYTNSSYSKPDIDTSNQNEESFEHPHIPAISISGVGNLTANINSPNYIVYDLTDKKTLFAQNADAKSYPASVTKLLTALVVLDYFEADEVFTVGEELTLVNPGSSIAYLQQGQRLTLETMIDALLLPSGNDAAYTLACGTIKKLEKDEFIPADEAVAEFVKLMNKKAKEIGAVDSNFVTPDGWHDDEHYTTPRDMAIIAMAASENELVKSSASKVTANHTILSGEVFNWINSNKLLFSGSTYYEPTVTGLKTGFTDKSGYCMAVSAVIGGHELYITTFGASTGDARFRDISAMLEAAANIIEE